MSDDSFTLPSFAKINLLLRILGKREDGFHELCTVFQTVSLADYLTFNKHEEIILTCSDPLIPADQRNLIVKAAFLLRERYEIKKGASIYLEKNIPAPGGLGGGSSNAAAALLGLSRLWELDVDFQTINMIARTLGADVPFFLRGGTALGTGRGDEILPLADIEDCLILIVTPNVFVSTADAFGRIKAAHLTNKSAKSILQICRNEADFVDLRQSDLINDFEESIFKIEPEIERVKNTILSFGAEKALLSGSGASVFGVFDKPKDLQNAFDNLKTESNWRVFSAETVSSRKYRNLLNIETDDYLKRF